LIALGVPVHAEGRDYHYEFLSGCSAPKLFVSGDRDKYGPVAQVEAVVRSAPPPAELVWIADADHFFVGKLDGMQGAIRKWVDAHFLASRIV
jgi:predicted alpha/beta-hydrolase family hydrolase